MIKLWDNFNLYSMSENNKSITVQVVVNAPVEKVWTCWSEPKDIMQWCHASDDWEVPHAENDLRVGGKFSTTMAAKSGNSRFDFSGVYTVVIPLKSIEYSMEDDRKVSISFEDNNGMTSVVETFDMENENTEEMQRAGWQAILDNFKKHVENN